MANRKIPRDHYRESTHSYSLQPVYEATVPVPATVDGYADATTGVFLPNTDPRQTRGMLVQVNIETNNFTSKEVRQVHEFNGTNEHTIVLDNAQSATNGGLLMGTQRTDNGSVPQKLVAKLRNFGVAKEQDINPRAGDAARNSGNRQFVTTVMQATDATANISDNANRVPAFDSLAGLN